MQRAKVRRVTVWVKDQEWRTFMRLARKRGRTASEYLRQIIRRELREPSLHSVESSLH